MQLMQRVVAIPRTSTQSTRHLEGQAESAKTNALLKELEVEKATLVGRESTLRSHTEKCECSLEKCGEHVEKESILLKRY